jgi:hypothetical protein
MSDHHLDPIDFAEGPECPLDCDGMGDFPRLSADANEDIVTCDSCGHVWSVPREKDCLDEPVDPVHEAFIESLYIENPLCPHENAWGECDTCDYLGDLAFDAAREGRGR